MRAAQPVTSVAASAPDSSIASAAASFSVVITSTARATSSGSATPRLIAVEITPRPRGFVRNSRDPGVAVGADDRVRLGETQGDHPELRLGVGDRVAAEHRGPAFVTTSIPPCRTSPSCSIGRSSTGHAAMLSARIGCAPIRVHVRERVRRSDPPPVVRVVDDRREEVERRDDRLLVRQPHDGRVVAGVRGHEDVGVELGHRQRAEQRLEIRRAELAPAARSVAELVSRRGSMREGYGRRQPLIAGGRCHR